MSGKRGMGLSITTGNSQLRYLSSLQTSLSDPNTHTEPIFARTHTDQNQIGIHPSQALPAWTADSQGVVNIKTILPLWFSISSLALFCRPFPLSLSVAIFFRLAPLSAGAIGGSCHVYVGFVVASSLPSFLFWRWEDKALNSSWL